ncbi:MAG: hypothetical protein GXP26_08265 [Planctomycetes bacterium]|nr:hypothetical protein [Planctomycetota bacterium]
MKSADSYSADELGQYRAMSSSAVLALLLGLVSPIAFFAPVLTIVPLLAGGMALIALSKTGNPDNGLSGARLAYVGLVLAITFGVASCTRIAVVNLLYSRHVDEVSATQPLEEK